MTILVATFTFRGDEEIAKYNTIAIQTLRELYPQYRIIHYLIDDANDPFKETFEDEGDTHYIKTDFNRNGNLLGISSFKGIAQTMDELAQQHSADWIIKLDSDSVMLTLDYINPEYDYIGSNAFDEPKIYSRGWCATYKAEVIHELNSFLESEENIEKVIAAKNERGYMDYMGEDVLFGAAIVDVLKKKALIGDLGGDMQLSFLYEDSQNINQNATCILCKIYNESPAHIIKRMQRGVETVKERTENLAQSKGQDSHDTILIVTFTHGGDEETMSHNVRSIQVIRRLYPQYRVVHYIVDDANNPFEQPMETKGDTRYMQSKFDRSEKLESAKAFIGVARTLDILAQRTNAHWVVKTEPSSILMNLDFLDENCDYIGHSETNGQDFYGLGGFAAYKPHTVHDVRMHAKVEKNLDEIIAACKLRGWHQTEDVMFGHTIVCKLNKRYLIGNICTFLDDSRTLDPNACCIVCKGKYLPGLRSHSHIYTGDKNTMTSQSVINRMQRAIEIMAARLK